jgi:hypothetical protein
VRDVVEDVEAREALRLEQLRGVRLRLLHQGGEHVAGLHLGPPGALHVEHGRLEHAAEGERLLGLALASARELLDRALQEPVEVVPDAGHVGAAGLEDALAVGIVRQRVEQVLQRQVRMPAARRFAVRDRQDDLERRTEHHAFSIVA